MLATCTPRLTIFLLVLTCHELMNVVSSAFPIHHCFIIVKVTPPLLTTDHLMDVRPLLELCDRNHELFDYCTVWIMEVPHSGSVWFGLRFDLQLLLTYVHLPFCA